MVTAVRRVSAHEAFELVERAGYAYLDVRSRGEYEQAHPAGSHNVPWVVAELSGARPNSDFVAAVCARFQREAHIVVGCQAGVRSVQACAALRAAGFANIADLRPGFGGLRDAFGQLEEPGWQACGLPVSHGPDSHGESGSTGT